MLQLLQVLFETLDRHEVRYCHWKSNAGLDQALEGAGDLDLLIAPADRVVAERILLDLGFVPAVLPTWRSRYGAVHYYGLDEQTARLVHIDLYEHLVSGGTLVKNHHLPLEAMVLSSLRRQSSVPVPSREAELLLLVLRKLLESASIPEHVLLLREYPQVVRELRWLLDDRSRCEALKLLRQWLPAVETQIFKRGVEALGSRAAVASRTRLGRRLQFQLQGCELVSGGRAEAERWGRLVRWLCRRVGLVSGDMRLREAGVLIAFVGPEGSGKSTLTRRTADWLGQALTVRSIHAGKPPPSLASIVPHLLAPMLRKTMPAYRSTSIEAAGVPTRRGLGLSLYSLRCLGLAFDRWLLLRRASRWREQGVIVVCDRYPSMQAGFVDSAQLHTDHSGPILGWLAYLEQRLYAGIPKPDLVITCRVPLEDALRRNRARAKAGGPEPEEFVRYRHAQFARGLPSEFEQHVVDTSQSTEETLRVVRGLVWQALVHVSSDRPLRRRGDAPGTFRYTVT